MFSVLNISAGYGKKVVVKSVSFTIEAGEFAVLLGLNGSGKTTLLKAICGLLKPKAGKITAKGTDITLANERTRAHFISYIPQRHSRLKSMSVMDVVLMGLNPKLGIFAHSSAAHKKIAREILQKMGLADYYDSDFQALSEGQKQLVILSRTLLQDAPILLMDEPDSSLDFLNRHKMLKDVRALIKAEGKAGLMTMHDPNLALTYADKLILIKDGEIIGDYPVDSKDVDHGLSSVYDGAKIIEYENMKILKF